MSELRRWCDQHSRLECSKRRSDRQDCHQTAVIPGTGACRKHVGKSLERAREDGRVALARVYAGGELPDVDPVAGLLMEVRRSAGVIAGLEGLVAELEASGEPGPGGALWWGTVREVTRDDGSTELERRAGEHVVLKAFNAERERFVRACLAAKTAGAQEAAVDAARSLGSQYGRLLDAIFDALVLTAEQRARVPQVVPMVLRQYEELEPAP